MKNVFVFVVAIATLFVVTPVSQMVMSETSMAVQSNDNAQACGLLRAIGRVGRGLGRGLGFGRSC